MTTVCQNVMVNSAIPSLFNLCIARLFMSAFECEYFFKSDANNFLAEFFFVENRISFEYLCYLISYLGKNVFRCGVLSGSYCRVEFYYAILDIHCPRENWIADRDWFAARIAGVNQESWLPNFLHPILTRFIR